ncbi:helix-turn-helix domain-containing protein [Leuconostoc citreum]|uniref:helix-turn-helix domain-containing protein n=1 Tax=Leuconostoc citreum TaxID=33964 RepID=UPI0021A35611|nr:helix-turn-helix domain-containing protein [Leuconostoc citreum]MCT3078252.1 helix-turn-helix domain-containing protein [Leuconostoc citreum]MCT3080451.1 helix-turn-helix domain-containing protein [Leuconostoc citreum]MCT3082878.1 helix-turn-helix domain-containing protein [Leuconostoc citreum]
MEEPNYYAIIPASVRYDKNLIKGSTLLYGEITALSNQKGFCWASDNYFSELYGVDKRSIQRWLSSLEENGYIQRIVEREGKQIKNRYIKICDKNVSTLTTKTSYRSDKNVVPPTDKNVRENNTSINTTNNNTTNTNTAYFEECWKMYPRKKGSKESAKRSFNKAIKSGVTVELIKSKIEEYKQEIAYKHTQEQYIKHGSTWFNQAGWQDEYETGNKPQKDLSKMTREQKLIEVMGKDGVRF